MARDMGLDVQGAPLFTIEPVEWEAPAPGQYDGLLVGSANIFRHGGKQLEKLTKLPVHAVGETTADAARTAGFLVGRTGRGGLQNLLDELSNRELHLLRLATMLPFAPLVPFVHDGVISSLRAYSPSALRALAAHADPAIEVTLRGGLLSPQVVLATRPH